MSNTKSQGSSQYGNINILKGLILLSLPILRFQQAIFPKIRSGLEEDKSGIVAAVEHFIAFELHAIMMLLDPTGKLRNRFDDEKLKALLKPVLDDVASGVISLVKAQEKIVQGLITSLDAIRNAERSKEK